MARGLAYVGKVNCLLPIENADRIESAEVVCGEGGKWRGVVKKGDFSIGAPCVVYLQDALVKPCDELKFLESTRWRVKMQRFRGSPSECVVMPLTHLKGELVHRFDVGEDITGVLGVSKYEKPIPACIAGKIEGSFPLFVPKTDEPNFQSQPALVAALFGKPYVATVKCDGSSSTAYRTANHFGVCSRNYELKETDENAFWIVANKYNLREKLPEGIALQWETCGPGIQKNPMGLSSIDGYAFSAYVIAEQRYLNFHELSDLCARIGFPMAPVDHIGNSFDMDDEAIRKAAEGLYPNGKQREGIVIRPLTEEWIGRTRLSVKAINLLYKE